MTIIRRTFEAQAYLNDLLELSKKHDLIIQPDCYGSAHGFVINNMSEYGISVLNKTIDGTKLKGGEV